METVDYLKLSEQYASFLVAVGGVSITVLTLVLSFGSDTRPPASVNARSFLVAALIVATVACFIGAHMMAETAAFISFHQTNKTILPTGDRLFLFGTINIFIAIILVMFALMLLPTSSRRVHAASIAPISAGVFGGVAIAALSWVYLAAWFRMPVKDGALVAGITLIFGSAGPILVCRFLKLSKKYLLWVTFAPSALTTVVSLFWFEWIFKEGDPVRLHGARLKDIWFFGLAITLSYASLVVAGLKLMRRKTCT